MSCGGSADGDPQAAEHAGGADPAPRQIAVVCTTAMIGDLATEIAGDAASVDVMFGPNIDPHLFRPTRDDVAVLMQADLVLFNGLALEGYLTDTIDRVAATGTTVVPIAERIVGEGELLHEGSSPDPHVWMDPSLWSRSCDLIADALISAGSETANEARDAHIAARADVAEARLLQLDRSFKKSIATIPANGRILVTAHDAFAYFGRRYGFEVEGIQGVSTASEAGLFAIEALVDRLVERKVPAVFFESTISERNIRALIEGADARGHHVEVGGVLHSDAPGDAVRYEPMLVHNVQTIVEALGGSVEESTASGSL